jgi:mannosyltransferase OCH1-like enzyme
LLLALSDLIRPLLLHTFGGVYIDTDVECYTDMTPWLEGADLVMQEEVSYAN